jgi:hypothetical protein
MTRAKTYITNCRLLFDKKIHRQFQLVSIKLIKTRAKNKRKRLASSQNGRSSSQP